MTSFGQDSHRGAFGSGFGSGFGMGPGGQHPLDGFLQAMDRMRGSVDKKVGTRMGRGDVREAVLVLLAEQPMHGYQLIKQIEERTQGRWRPSAGSVYPTLQLLADEGLVTTHMEQDRKIYELTQEGQEAAAASTAPWTSAADERADSPTMTALPKAGVELAQAVAQAFRSGSPAQHEQVIEILDAARRKVYAVLAQD